MRWVSSPLGSFGRLLLTALSALATTTQALCCDTPVYRYAMYRWPPAPYEVYFFHDQAPGEADQKTAKRLAAFLENQESPANVVHIAVDLVKDKELTTVPPDIKQALLAHGKSALPSYLVATPYGIEIFFGKLDEPDVQSLVDSPARKNIADQLAAGKIGVLVFVTSSDKAADDAAESVITGVVREVKEGKIELYMPPSDPAMMGDPQGKPASPSYELGFVKIGRNDPQEQWLVRMLHAMEPELKKEDSPMTFMAYGRGRVLLPCIGKGITRENLVYMIEFITSACSCTVKEQNPGVDLLVRYDWEAAAAKLAEKFAAEEGAPGMFYPELVIPSSAASNAQLAPAQDAKPAATAPGTSAEAPAAENASVAGLGKTESPPSAAPSPIEKKPPEAASKAEGAPAAAVAPEVSVASNTNRPPAKAAVPMAAEPGSSVSMYSSVVVVGGGVVIGLLALFGFTFYVLRSA